MKNLIKTTVIGLCLAFSTVQASDVSDVLKNSYKIYNYGQTKSTGSGFVSDKLKGYIITNRHVVEGAEIIKVQGIDREKHEGEVVYVSAKYDLAIIKTKLKDENLYGINHCEKKTFSIGSDLYNFGNPAGIEFIYTKGYISGIPRQFLESGQKNKFLVHNLIGYSGQSGSALLLADKSCIAGVVTAGLMSAEIGLSIQVSDLEIMINEFKENKNNLLDFKTFNNGTKVTVILTDKTYFDEKTGILYLKRTEVNYKLMLTLALFVILLELYSKRRK